MEDDNNTGRRAIKETGLGIFGISLGYQVAAFSPFWANKSSPRSLCQKESNEPHFGQKGSNGATW